MSRGERRPLPPPAEVNILLVDDESRNLDALESFLESPEYRLVRKLSGHEALLALLEGEFAVLVLDVQMPGMTGIELANIIKQRKRTQHIPIIFLTAYYQEDADVMQGYNIGAVDYLTKPINPKILQSKINVFVDLFRKSKALAALNTALEAEVAQRLRAEEELREANNDLEARVQARTADLSRVNEELRERETALRVSEAQAKAASQAKDDFLATLSHELRTPLNPVLLLASDGAKNPLHPPATRADFEIIAKNAAMEARLIDDLLDITRIARGKFSLESQALDLHAVIADSLDMARAEIEQKRIKVDQRLEARPSMISGDDVRLKQVFWNVLKNAGKFTPHSGQITVESTIGGNPPMITVRITDTGIGMSAAELGRIFEPFSQGDHAAQGSAHRFGGIGLGLAISRKMVELHAGQIEATSRGPGLGTSVVMRFPALTGSSECDPAGPAQRAEPETGSGKEEVIARILLVEDHEPTSRALRQLLVRRRFDVATANSVAEARQVAARWPFDFLISDIGLPDGSGYELIAGLKTQRNVLGIALSGYGMEADLKRSEDAGFIAHLTKPVTVQALETALRSIRAERDRRSTPA